MINQPYASLPRCIELGYGSNADEVCGNLVGKIDEIDLGETTHDEPTEWTKIRILSAHVEYDPNSMHPYYVNVDAEDINGQE